MSFLYAGFTCVFCEFIFDVFPVQPADALVLIVADEQAQTRLKVQGTEVGRQKTDGRYCMMIHAISFLSSVICLLTLG